MIHDAASNRADSRNHADRSRSSLEQRHDAQPGRGSIASEIRCVAEACRGSGVPAILWRTGEAAILTEPCAPNPPLWRYADRRAVASGHVSLRLCESGKPRGASEDRPEVLRTREIHFSDIAAEDPMPSQQGQRLTFLIPYAAVGYDPSRHPAQLRIGAGTAQGRVLATTMLCLAEQLPTASPDEARTLAQGLTGLVRGLLLNDRPDGEGRAQIEVTQRTAMRRYIEDNLDDPNLGAELLCEVFHASRATVYRQFGEVGGVSRYVKERRLDRAFNDLAMKPAARGRVRQVAERWGFFDAGHFNRVFRQRFGLSPSEVLALGEMTADAATFRATCGLALRATPD